MILLHLPVCNADLSGRIPPMFRRNILPPISRFKDKASKKAAPKVGVLVLGP
jgi:hypothetical protein